MAMSARGPDGHLKVLGMSYWRPQSLEGIPDIDKCKRVSDLPMKFCTRVWTILNSLIWNSQTWILSKSFKEDLKKIKEQRPPSPWVWVDTVHISNPFLYEWMGWDIRSLPRGTIPSALVRG
ncbi:MAG: hypothetical protein IKR86_09790 [Candidatus Methanomethylophilaceae archaeon]|nr:hypothetical protein [Candidatus Methanomethylophilaceae archaeon]